jgi:hypothetical protein
MKCPKCGFVSYDHLSECKKCGANLVAVREVLGFSALKSEVPFLLGTLLTSGSRGDIPGPGTGEEAAHDDFSYDSEGSLRGTVDFEQADSKTASAVADEVKSKGSGNDELLIELSEADLEDLPGIDANRGTTGQTKDG